MWQGFLFDTVTGLVGARLDLAAEGSWSMELNGVPAWTVTLAKAQWVRFDPRWWRPWATGVLMTWDDTPVLAGPIIELPTSTRDMVTLSCQGVEAVLGRRLVLKQGYGPGEEKQLTGSTVALTGLSLGTIMQEVVAHAMNRGGAALPIVFKVPREKGIHERTFEGWNLQNNGCLKRLTELSEVIGGPDFAFRPEWERPGEKIRWGMWHGTNGSPFIPQKRIVSLDLTAPTGVVAEYTITPDSTEITSKHYETGAGEGPGLLVVVREDPARLWDGMPLLESVASTSDTETPKVLVDRAETAISAGGAPLIQLTVKVDGAAPRLSLGSWWVGDAMRVTLKDELLVPDGAREWRVIAAKGAWDSQIIDIEFQEERVGRGEAS